MIIPTCTTTAITAARTLICAPRFGNDANAYLQHFVNYGMAEGRQGRASFNVYTYRDEHPELWEKFGDNLRGYYLWACGIPQ